MRRYVYTQISYMLLRDIYHAVPLLSLQIGGGVAGAVVVC